MPSTRCSCIAKECAKTIDLTKSNTFREISTPAYEWLRDRLESKGITFNNDNLIYLCKACEAKYRREEKQIDEENERVFKDSTLSVPNPIIPAQKCFQIPTQVNFCCFYLFVEHDVYVYARQKCCGSHLKGTRLNPDITIDTRQYEPTMLTIEEASNLIFQLKNDIKNKRNRSLLSLDNPLIDEEDLKSWTGWKKSDLQTMYTTISDSKVMRDSKHRSVADALILYWVKMKTNLSYSQIGTLFNYDLSAEDRGKRFNHLTPQQIESHDTIYSKMFFGDGNKIMLDATYLFINKSGDNVLQKKTYSGQKKKHYVKTLSETLSDGYVLAVEGPFPGSKNDAQITEYLLENDTELRKWCQPGNCVIFDRGFDRVRELFEQMGVDCKMPTFLKSKQHSVEEANHTRLITKIRCSIEMYHGRLKKFQFLYQTIPNSLFEKIVPCVKIITAALNAFRPPLIKPTDPEKEEKLAKIMKIRVESVNTLKERVLERPFNSRCKWEKLDGTQIDFPQTTEDQLRDLCFGVYQIKQAKTYSEAHLNKNDGDYEVEVIKETDTLIRCKTDSRHSGST
ncbi:unnamed protein product [Didymodactylos carnosus]|uniref:DDE Tnp4 domain-containing protein n=1 Tax=Didymodactylos carnosus TaxID=1234261 RepID=A0A815ZB76_9BILA|nr:unnamed protein product [Didymodactylos carnosus]CAF4448491.1 unnamed protein product [Didymodactylos carnosus]